MDVGDLLELERAFERQRISAAAAEIEDIAGERDLGGDPLDALVVVQDFAGAGRDLGHDPHELGLAGMINCARANATVNRRSQRVA
jgi:hypothetical protein